MNARSQVFELVSFWAAYVLIIYAVVCFSATYTGLQNVNKLQR